MQTDNISVRDDIELRTFLQLLLYIVNEILTPEQLDKIKDKIKKLGIGKK